MPLQPDDAKKYFDQVDQEVSSIQRKIEKSADWVSTQEFVHEVQALFNKFPDKRAAIYTAAFGNEDPEQLQQNISSSLKSSNEQLSFTNNILIVLGAGFLGFAYKIEMLHHLHFWKLLVKILPLILVAISILLGLICVSNSFELRYKEFLNSP